MKEITTTEATPGLFFKYCVLENFLEAELVQQLLDYTLENQNRFVATQVIGSEFSGVSDSNIRVSAGLYDLGACKKPLKERLRAVEPNLRMRLGLDPYVLKGIELQLIAHNDGAFYRSHIDVGSSEKASYRQRVISAIYYFHACPKAFTGGALRLHALSGTETIDVEPLHNSLLVFPSFAPHEVMPVSCPSGAFMDSRFAINCWFHRVRLDVP